NCRSRRLRDGHQISEYAFHECCFRFFRLQTRNPRAESPYQIQRVRKIGHTSDAGAAGERTIGSGAQMTKPAVPLPLIVPHIPTPPPTQPHWVNWRKRTLPGPTNPAKIPYNPRTGRFASSTDPRSWSSLDQALAVVAQYDGVGYVFVPENEIVGIDL